MIDQALTFLKEWWDSHQDAKRRIKAAEDALVDLRGAVGVLFLEVNALRNGGTAITDANLARLKASAEALERLAIGG